VNVLILNAGSSSLKFQVIATDLERIKQSSDQRLCRGQVERIGGEAIITVQSHDGQRHKLTAPIRDISAAVDYVLRSRRTRRAFPKFGISATFTPWDIAWCTVESCFMNPLSLVSG
jgi:acetate kinase